MGIGLDIWRSRKLRTWNYCFAVTVESKAFEKRVGSGWPSMAVEEDSAGRGEGRVAPACTSHRQKVRTHNLTGQVFKRPGACRRPQSFLTPSTHGPPNPFSRSAPRSS